MKIRKLDQKVISYFKVIGDFSADWGVSMAFKLLFPNGVVLNDGVIIWKTEEDIVTLNKIL